MAANVFVFANNKGGVKKTTNTLHIGYNLANRGYKTLIVSMDPQCNIDFTLLGFIDEDELELDEETLGAFEKEFSQFDGEYSWDDLPRGEPKEEEETEVEYPGEGVPTMYDVIIGINGDLNKKRHIKEVIIQVPQQENLYLAKGSIELTNMDITLASEIGREKILKRALESVSNEFDFILIDTPPTLGLSPVNAFVAAGHNHTGRNGVVICISPQTYSVLGIQTLLNAIARMRDKLDIPLPIFGVVCAEVKNTKNARKREDEVRRNFKKAVFKTAIPVNEKIEEAANKQESLRTYAASSTGAQAYDQLTSEFLKRAGLPERKA